MPPRRSKRIRTGKKPDYVEPPTSDDDANDSDDDYIPHDLLILLHNAITNASNMEDEDIEVAPQVTKTK